MDRPESESGSALQAARFTLRVYIPDGPLDSVRTQFEDGISRWRTAQRDGPPPQPTSTGVPLSSAKRVDLSIAGLWMATGANKIVLRFPPLDQIHYTLTFLKDGAELHMTDENKKAAGEQWWIPLGRLTAENFLPRATLARDGLRKFMDDHTLIVPIDRMERFGFALMPDVSVESVLVGTRRKVSFSSESALANADVRLEKEFAFDYGMKYTGCFYEARDRDIVMSELGLLVFAPNQSRTAPIGFGFIPMAAYMQGTLGLIGAMLTGGNGQDASRA